MNRNTVIKDFGFNELEIGDVYADWIFSIVKPFVGKRILEVGCGLGLNATYLTQSEYTVLSDINSEYLAIAKQRYSRNDKIQFIQLNLLHIPSKLKSSLVDYKFDTVLAVNVLEHIEDDTLALKNIHQILGKNGKIILFIPALPIIYGTIDESFGHVRRYTRRVLRKKLKAANFEISYIKYFNFIGIFWWFIAGKILRKRNLPRMTGRLLKIIVPILQKIESIIPIPIGQSIIVVAKKL